MRRIIQLAMGLLVSAVVGFMYIDETRLLLTLNSSRQITFREVVKGGLLVGQLESSLPRNEKTSQEDWKHESSTNHSLPDDGYEKRPSRSSLDSMSGTNRRISNNAEDPIEEVAAKNQQFQPVQPAVSYKRETDMLQPVMRPSIENVSDVNALNVTADPQDEVSIHEKKWPPLSSLLDSTTHVRKANITGDVQFLLDFAIVGRKYSQINSRNNTQIHCGKLTQPIDQTYSDPKTATTFLTRWLGKHEEIQIFPNEVHSLTYGHPGEFVSQMYSLPEGDQYIRGYKAPRDIQDRKVLRLFRELWPQTKLIVGMRHPVLWFESFYNYRIHQGRQIPLANSSLFTHISQRIGRCYKKPKVTMCTDGSLFQNHLSLLGKTNMSTEELPLIRPRPPESQEKHKYMTNKVFLYDQSQLNDSNETRAASFRQDLASFLGMKESLREDLRDPPAASKEKKEHNRTISICDDSHKDLRVELMKNARTASQWIRKYFLEHEDVFVSSPDYFRSLLETWMKDPCEHDSRATSKL